MKHQLSIKHLALTIIICLFTSAALSAKSDKHTGDTQVILRAAAPFTTVILNSDLNVEIDIRPEYAGHIVYFKSDAGAPKIQCISAENNLIINSSAEQGAVCSRVRILCGSDLQSVINNGTGRIICPDLKNNLDADFNLINNNSGDIGVREAELRGIAIVNNAGGRIGIKKLKATGVDMVQNGTGKIYVAGKANEGRLALNSSGEIIANKTAIDDIHASLIGSGAINCHYTENLNAYINGSGNIYYLSKGGKAGKNITIRRDDSAGTTDPHVIPSEFNKSNNRH